MYWIVNQYSKDRIVGFPTVLEFFALVQVATQKFCHRWTLDDFKIVKAFIHQQRSSSRATTNNYGTL